MQGKFELVELKKALTWIETNTRDMAVRLQIVEGILYINTTDKYESSVEIKVYHVDAHLMPTISKTERL